MARRPRDAVSFLARFGRSSHSVDPVRTADSSIPQGVIVAGAWSWRLLLIAAAALGLIWLILQVKDIAIPFIIAVLISGLLVPYSNWMQRHRVPRWLAVALAFLSALVVVTGLIFLLSNRVSAEAPHLDTQIRDSLSGLSVWLQGPPFNFSSVQIEGYIDKITASFKFDNASLLSGALTVGSTVGHVLTGVLLTSFSTLFILIDGAGIWAWIVRIFPKKARAAIDGAGQAGWLTLMSFARVQVLVAFIDALGIGLGAFFLGLPLVIPISVLVFFGSFIPIVGAVVTGAVAVFIALVFKGFWFAIIMLAVTVLVQEIEAHVLQPLIMGTAVKVHPLAVVLVVAGGSYLGGISGALFAVPIAATVNVVIRYIASGAWREEAAAARAAASFSQIWRTVPRKAPWQ
ncbi:AI-2E family transporter [Gryllotalpicola sp.]|uniref:AI-2E family transporter n=1 Tax=Gryllotalpicola sp. TaxID=1932787 RepID=UPI00261F8070|nr:AI-2E family transporter [Gryllotalpicola sp.]